ncbi:MAG: protein kinase [Methylococcales bacterium]
MTMQLELQCGIATDRGKRESNEDFVAFYKGTDEERVVHGSTVVIADGIGGTSGGRFAAELTVCGFLDAFYNQKETLGIDQMADNALASMNRWIHSQARQDPALKHMGTTFTALILRGSQAHIAHLGDTRIYRLADGKLQCLTTDHTHHHPDLQHVLTRAVGIEDTVCIDYAAHNLNLHDRFLLCCDGVWSALGDKKIQNLLSQNKSSQEDAEDIVQAALKAGSQDNVSAIVIDVLKLPPPDESFLETTIDELSILASSKVNDVIDGFRLVKKISDSRYTSLFVARDEKGSHGEVVMKFPKPGTTTEAIYRQAFIREKWITSHIRTPWIATQIALEEGRQTRLYTIMPHYRGKTLEQNLQHKISLERGVEIAIMLAKAVYSLHRERIIHRDIKPDNVILLDDGGLILLDLGVALLPGLQDGLESTAPGTPSYMAPELFRGEQGSEPSDLYALGVTLYRMFSKGHYPYGEVEPFSRPRFDKLVPLSKYRPDFPAWLDGLMARAVSTEKRFDSAMDLAFELEKGFAHGSTVLPMKDSLHERNPVLFWRLVSLGLFFLFIIALMI